MGLTGWRGAERSFGSVLKQVFICGRALSTISLSRYSSHTVANSAAALQAVLETVIEMDSDGNERDLHLFFFLFVCFDRWIR